LKKINKADLNVKYFVSSPLLLGEENPSPSLSYCFNIQSIIEIIHYANETIND